MGARETRLAVLLAVAALVLAGAGVVAVVADDGGTDRAAVSEQVAGDPTTTTTAAPAVETTTSTTAAVTSTSTSGPNTTVRRSTTTTRSPTSTTASPTTTARPTTSTTGAQPQPCLAGQVAVTGGTSSPSYPAGQPVTFASTITNASSTPCFYRGYTVQLRFRDPAGTLIIGNVVHADDIEFRPFLPGQAITHSATWDPRRCATPPCPPPAPGIYSAEADWSFSGGRYTVTRQFLLR